MTNPCLFGEMDERGITAVWEVTKICQLRCPHCCSDSGESQQESIGNCLNQEEAFKILDILNNNNVRVLYISGGEPLLWEHLPSLLQRANSYGIDCCVATSGYVPNKNREKLRNLDIYAFHVSLDSWNAQNHDNFRGVTGAFERALDFISFAKNMGTKVVTSTMISDDLIEHSDEFYQVTAKQGVDRSVLNFFVPLGRASSLQSDILSASERAKITKYIFEKAKLHNVTATVNRLHSGGIGLEQCPAGRKLVFINASGKVSPCSWIAKMWPKFSVDISETIFPATLIDELDSDIFDLTKSKCYDCKHKTDCGYGCPIIARFDEKGFDTLCNVDGDVYEI